MDAQICSAHVYRLDEQCGMAYVWPHACSRLLKSVNKEVPRWIKQWDRCELGRVSFAPMPVFTSESHPMDRLERPKHTLLLITDPPGLGKTAAAHIITKQADSDVIEINARCGCVATTERCLTNCASDDRTSQALENKSKPSCSRSPAGIDRNC